MRDKLKWLIKLPTTDYQEVTPLYEDISFNDAVYKNKFFRKDLKVDLTFSKDDFDLIYTLERANDPCLTLPIKIQIFETATSQYVDKWSGFISLKKGDYDLNKCSAKFTPETSDIYDCVIEGEKQKIDLFQIVDRSTIDTVTGTLEFENKTYSLDAHSGFDTTFVPQLSVTEGWSIYQRELIEEERGSLFAPPDIHIYVKDRYVRQYIIQPTQPYSGWVNVGSNKWVAAVSTRLDSSTENYTISEDTTSGEYESFRTFMFNYTVIDIEADNAILLADIIPLLIDCDKTIISNFLDINADATAPTNQAYEYAEDHLQNIHVFQASDIINADASQNATKFEIKKGELFYDILDFFNLEFFFDEDEDAFRIEHVSYRNAIRGANLLLTSFEDIKDSFNYNYDTDEVPLTQTFKFKYDTNSQQFDSALIEYDANCSNGNDDPLRLKNIVTNVSEIYNNEDYKNDNSLYSAVLISVQNGTIESQNGVLNYPLSFKAIIEALHVYRRPLREGIVNDNLLTFESTVPIKLQEVTIKISTLQFFNDYSPNKQYKTQLGWGEVKSSEYDKATQQLKIKLLH